MHHLKLINPRAPMRIEQPLLGGYLLDGGITSLTGPKSSFKSLTAQTIALALIRQAHFGDAKAEGTHKAVYMTPQSRTAAETIRRLSADSDPESLFVCTPVNLARSRTTQLDGSENMVWTSKATQRFFKDLDSCGKMSLLIVDGLAGLSEGYRLNFDTEAYEFAKALRGLLAHFSAILIVDNSAAQGGLKVAPALLDAIDVDLRLIRYRNSRERLSDPNKASAMLSCYTTRSGTYPAPVEIALSAKTFSLTSFPLEMSIQDVEAQAPDFLEPVQRLEVDHLLRKTQPMTVSQILNMGRLPRMDLSHKGDLRYLEGGILERIVERIESRCHLPRDPLMSLPEYMRRVLAHHRERIIYNPFNADSVNFEESDNEEF